MNGVLPLWARRLARECPGYQFRRHPVRSEVSVAAERVSGTGPVIVITANEQEMREALGMTGRTGAAEGLQ